MARAIESITLGSTSVRASSNSFSVTRRVSAVRFALSIALVKRSSHSSPVMRTLVTIRSTIWDAVKCSPHIWSQAACTPGESSVSSNAFFFNSTAISAALIFLASIIFICKIISCVNLCYLSEKSYFAATVQENSQHLHLIPLSNTLLIIGQSFPLPIGHANPPLIYATVQTLA